MTPVDRHIGTFQFDVTIEGISKDQVNQQFTRVSGLATESEQLTWMQGTDASVNTAPGRVKYADINLERVYDGSDGIYRWRRLIERGGGMDPTESYRKNVYVRLRRRDGSTARAMALIGAWPSRWQMPDLDANSSSPAVETIVLTVAEVFETTEEELAKLPAFKDPSAP
jgi:phage tail-like protein